MVVGNGLLASTFRQKYDNTDKVLIFASGVSNSEEKSLAQYEREEELLIRSLSAHPNMLFVYFSTYSIADPENKAKIYVKHKLKMESIISDSENFLILRLPNVIGKTNNPHTIVNYFANKLLNNEEIIVWSNASRNLLCVDDIFDITNDLIIRGITNQILNLTNPKNISPREMVETLATFFKKKAKIHLNNRGASFEVAPSEEVLKSMSFLGLTFPESYFIAKLEKHFKK